MARRSLPCLAIALLAGAARAKPSKPNIVFVLVDDWGWGNAGYHRPDDPEVVTPNVDKLVKEGIELDRHYVYHYCSPSRSTLQSGRLSVHVSYTNDEQTVSNPEDPVSGYAGIPRNMTGIAEKMRMAGYRTHATGKWDAGMATWEHTPLGRGYESWFGYFNHANDYYTQRVTSNGPAGCGDLVDLWNGTGPARDRNGTAYEEEMFTNNTLDILERHNAEEPLFLFHAFHQIHTPLEVPEAWEKKFGFLSNPTRRKYAAMVNYMDTALGRIVDKIKEKGMWENTLMVVSSDNGGPIYYLPKVGAGGASNRPLRGGKLADWEGGVRVNAFVTGGAVPAGKRGTVLSDYIHLCDWYATFCSIAGVDPTDHKAAAAALPPVDGIDQSALLIGSAPHGSGNRTEIHHSTAALTQGRWKLITGGIMDYPQLPISPNGSRWVPFSTWGDGWGYEALENDLSFLNCGDGCLFDIQADPTEHHDVADVNSDVRANMRARLEELNQGVFLPSRGSNDPRACQAWNGFYGPFADEPAARPSAVAHLLV